MTLTSSQAVVLTNNAINVQNTRDLVQEITLAEQNIRNAATRQQFQIIYNARIIGNPDEDPSDTDRLSEQQVEFRDNLEQSGYILRRDGDTGYWLISWEVQGIEELVNVYSIRTTLDPSGVESDTISAVENFFENLTPRNRVNVKLVPFGGGNINEPDFGATPSTSYEYTAVVDQSDQSVDHSSGLKAALVASGLGYDDTGSDNIEVYKVI